MKTYIALLRGINVVGKNPLPMKELTSLLEGMGARNARTYIQSGNAVFYYAGRAPAGLAGQLAAGIKRRRGFEPHVLVLTLDDLEKALEGNPFPEGEAEPSTLHLGFLAAVPKAPDTRKLDGLKAARERYHLGGRVFYMHLPDGYGRSKLAAGAEKALGVPMTVRNWRTACEIKNMARA